MGRLSWKRYLCTKEIFLTTIGIFIYTIWHLLKSNAEGITQYLVFSMQTRQVYFLFFLFVTYSFLVKCKQVRLLETVQGIKGGYQKQLASQCLVIVTFICLTCFIYWVQGVYVSISLGAYSLEFMKYYSKLIILHYFLLFCFAMLLGMLVAEIKSQIKAFSILFVIYFVFSASNISVLRQVSYGNEFLYRGTQFLSIYAQDYFALSDFYYLFSIEKENMERILAWIFLSIAFMTVLKEKGYKKCFGIVSGGIALICILLYIQPSSAVNLDCGVSGQDAASADDIYYKLHNAPQAEDAVFKITNLKGDFWVNRELSARVTLTVNCDNLAVYDFSLYHGYIIEKIEDQNGIELPFTQEGDIVSVLAKGNNIKKLTFHYKGHCARYYTTTQGIFLPGYFAFYPMPGKRKLYITENGYYGNAIEGLGYSIEYNVHLHTKQAAYSNLKRLDENTFVGKSDGIAIYASNFIREKVIGGCTILYSELWENRASLDDKSYNDFIEKYTKRTNHKPVIWFIPPEINGQFYYWAKDQLMGAIDVLDQRFDFYLKTGELYEFISEEEIENALDTLREEE